MAKRFTDTEKWKRPWYRKLPPAFRELWNYILDSCDHAGIWIEDLELAEMILGFKIDLQEYEEYLGPKIIRVDEDKIFIPSFIEFQYGKELDPECKPHRSVIKTLERYRIDTLTLQLAKGIEIVPKSIDTLKDKDKNQDKDQEKKKGGVGENKNPEPPPADPDPPPPPTRTSFDFEAIYREYPRKDGKAEGLKLCKARIKTQDEYDKLLIAVRRYRDDCLNKGIEKEFIKHFCTFMGKDRWTDWLDPETGTGIEVGPAGKTNWSKVFEEDPS